MSTPGENSSAATPQLAETRESGRGAHWALVVIILALVCFMMRLSGLMALPIFGDEAIYLRWAQLIRGEGITTGPGVVAGAHPWISLADPKPPLHFWLIALFYHGALNPLVPARYISVVSGVLSVPLLFGVGVELGSLVRVREHGVGGAVAPGGTGKTPIFATGHVLGLLATLLMIFCPFFSFYQRLATADALFAMESLAIVWLSLRWGRLATHPADSHPRSAWIAAIFLGIAIGAALMTRQGLSYTLALMPAVAWVLHAWGLPQASEKDGAARSSGRRRILLTSVMQLMLAAVISAGLWTPFLTAELSERALESKRESLADPAATLAPGDLLKEVQRRVFYQDNFTERQNGWAIAGRNLRLAFVPGANDRGVMDYGWLYYYLTPGVYMASLVGLVYIAARRQWRVLVLLLAWILLAMGPVVLLANVIYSRYVLAGAAPFLVAAAFFVGDLLGILFTRYERLPVIPWTASCLLFFALLFPSLRELGTQASRWWDQTLTARDNYQYISGWPAGRATEKAIVSLMDLSRGGPLVIITDNGWGTPADAVWVYLAGRKNIQLYYTDREAILDPATGSPDDAGQAARAMARGVMGKAERDGQAVWLRTNKWLYPPYEKVILPPDVPILYVTKEGRAPALDRLRERNPNIVQRETFRGAGNPRTGESDPEGSVSIFQLPRPIE